MLFIIKNNSGTKININSLGIILENTEERDVTEEFSDDILWGNDEIISKINSGDIIINNGVADLSTNIGVAYVSRRFSHLVRKKSIFPIFPRYLSSVIMDRGINGSISLQSESDSGKNYYFYDKVSSNLEYMIIKFQYILPSFFESWGVNSLLLDYKTTNANALDNKVNWYVYCNNILAASKIDLTSITWATSVINYTDMTSGVTWNAGDRLTICIQVYAKSNTNICVSKLDANFV